MDAPPVRGAVQPTTDCVPPPLVPDTPVGAPGEPWVSELEAADAGPAPVVLVAVTLNVYTVLAVRNETVQEVVAAVVQVWPPLEVTVYPVMADPPLEAGAVQDTASAPVVDVAVAVAAVGAPGAVAGTAAADGAEALPVPAAFVAVTVKV